MRPLLFKHAAAHYPPLDVSTTSSATFVHPVDNTQFPYTWPATFNK